MKVRIALRLVILDLLAGTPVAQIAEQIGDPVVVPGPHNVAADARALHARLTAVDLHADTMLSTRDLRTEEGFGHVDLPRLLRCGVAVQVSSAPLNMRPCLSVARCAAGIDILALFSVAAARSGGAARRAARAGGRRRCASPPTALTCTGTPHERASPTDRVRMESRSDR